MEAERASLPLAPDTRRRTRASGRSGRLLASAERLARDLKQKPSLSGAADRAARQEQGPRGPPGLHTGFVIARLGKSCFTLRSGRCRVLTVCAREHACVRVNPCVHVSPCVHVCVRDPSLEPWPHPPGEKCCRHPGREERCWGWGPWRRDHVTWAGARGQQERDPLGRGAGRAASGSWASLPLKPGSSRGQEACGWVWLRLTKALLGTPVPEFHIVFTCHKT